MRTIHRLGATLIALALAAGCSTDDPASPTAPPAQPVTPGPAATSVTLTITVSPGEIEAGRVEAIQWVERGRGDARHPEGIEDMDRAELRAMAGGDAGILAFGVDADDRTGIVE